MTSPRGREPAEVAQRDARKKRALHLYYAGHKVFDIAAIAGVYSAQVYRWIQEHEAQIDQQTGKGKS